MCLFYNKISQQNLILLARPYPISIEKTEFSYKKEPIKNDANYGVSMTSVRNYGCQ